MGNNGGNFSVFSDLDNISFTSLQLPKDFLLYECKRMCV